MSFTTTAEDQYFRILDTAPDAMVVVGEDQRIAFVNAQTEKMFGYARADLLGKRLELLVPERFRGAHGGHVGRYFAQPGVRPMGSGLQLYGRRSDGSEVAIEVSLSPVRVGDSVLVSAAIRDITDRKRSEAAAKLAADRLASAVDSIQDAFALFDHRGALVSSNAAFRELTSASGGPSATYEEIFEAWSAAMAFGSESERRAFAADRAADRGAERASFEIRLRDGRRLRATNQRTLEGGLVQTIWDLTDDQRREDELRRAREAAEAGSAAKTEFLSSISHELRTPLNAILGFAQLLQRDKREPLSPRHRERVDQILRSGEHLLRLIQDVLDLSRIEAGNISIDLEAVDLQVVLMNLRTTLVPLASQEAVTVAPFETPRDLPRVSADPTRLAQVVMNFATNAIKYNRPGGEVSLRVTQEGDRVRVTIADTGIGIAPELQGKLFQPFQRAGQEMGPIEGTGIGLSIAKRLAELMHGAVGFTSVPGVGSEFWVEIPVATSPASVPVVVGARAADGLVLPLGARRLVLYVEDNPANVAFLRDALSVYEQLELLVAPTAELGIALARTRAPALVIVDVNLPGMSGVEAVRVMRRLPETRATPVIALTAEVSERAREAGLEAGFDRYLTKPLRIEQLEAALHELLGGVTL